MAVKTFLKWPDKRLRTRARDIAEITNDINLIWDGYDLIKILSREIEIK